MAPSPTLTWSAIPTCPASTTPRPSFEDPETPTWASRIECSPTSTLCPIWTRLSILVPRRTMVSPKVARHRKIPQTGGGVIEDDVEIGANTTIDRANFGDTIVLRRAKIDNLVEIGHNVEVGEHSILVAQVGVSGSSKLGRGVVLAGQVGIADHVSVGDGAMVAAQGGVPSDLAAGGRYLGTPARPAMEARRIVAAESRLPELLQRVRALERAVEALGGGPLGRKGARDEGRDPPLGDHRSAR